MYDWSYFGCIYCISHRNAHMKRSDINHLATKLNLPVIYRTYDSNIFDAHISVIREARHKGYRQVVILQDNVTIGNINERMLREIVEYLQTNSWDMFCFTSIPDYRLDNSCTETKKGMYKIKSMYSTMYAINTDAMERYYDISYTCQSIDETFKNDTRLNVIGSFPSPMYPETKFSVPQGVMNNILYIVSLYGYYIGMKITHPAYRILILLIVYLTLVYYNEDLIDLDFEDD